MTLQSSRVSMIVVVVVVVMSTADREDEAGDIDSKVRQVCR